MDQARLAQNTYILFFNELVKKLYNFICNCNYFDDISIFSKFLPKNRNFDQKSKSSPKIENLTKNRNLDQKSKSWAKI